MNLKIIAVVIVTLVLGVGGGYWLASRNTVTSTAVRDVGHESERQTQSASNDAPGTVRIDPVIVQDIGVRTALAVRKTLTRDVKSVGRVAYDEKLISRLHPKTEGWIDKLRVDETGMQVKKGEILLSIYSPRLADAYHGR